MKNLLTVGILLLIFCSTKGQDISNPGSQWMQFKNSEDAGFDSVKLNTVKKVFLEQGGDALFIIRNGKVVLSVGQSARCFRQTSIRKSYLNALYGIYSTNGTIDLNKTLAELEIDDIHSLTHSEKEASILDLLKSRSGVYHSSAYSSESMEKRLPTRGSFKHGQNWFYNNWDFNTLGTIFNKITKKDLFKEFEKQISITLQFEDFDITKTKYFYEYNKSKHAAYLFRMSARDMARFGLLYLNKGKWGDNHILDSGWVDKSFKSHSKNGTYAQGIHWDDYGLLWWISNQIMEEPVYYASGSGVQRIIIFPNSEMVMVHLVDNYQPKKVGEEKVDTLIRLLLEAKKGEPVLDPDVIPLPIEKFEINKAVIPQDSLSKFTGIYSNPRLGNFSIKAVTNYLLLESGIGNFNLYPINGNIFISEDIQVPMHFKKGKNDAIGTFNVKMNDKRSKVKFEFFY